MTYRGSANRVASGTVFKRIGWPGQGPGKVAAAYQWNRVLTEQEMNIVLASGPSGNLSGAGETTTANYSLPILTCPCNKVRPSAQISCAHLASNEGPYVNVLSMRQDWQAAGSRQQAGWRAGGLAGWPAGGQAGRQVGGQSQTD